VQIAWRSGGSVADTDITTGDDRSQAQASTAAAERAARIAATDLATVELAQADPRAFAPLSTRYAPIVLNYLRRRIADPDAADATSLVFTRALVRSRGSRRPMARVPGRWSRAGWSLAGSGNNTMIPVTVPPPAQG